MRSRRLAPIALALAALFAAAPAAAFQESRDLAGIADEQEHLLRQLQRLRRTMESLIPRLEEEGRTRALDLLREGLVHLDERLAAAGSLTLEELMDTAREGVESGQAVHSLENQEQVIAGLERLLSILLDRESLDSLEDSLADLREIRRGAQQLAEREAALEQATRELREQSANQQQRELESELERMTAEQRELLAETERLGRASGTLELEQIERELEQLIERQRIDGAVLESWRPELREQLEALAPLLEAARRETARAERLQRAAESLREAGENATAATSPEELSAWTTKLDADAEREERHQRASGDESARRSSAALREAAGRLREAGLNDEARAEAAAELERQASALEAAADERAAAAVEQRDRALSSLEQEAGSGERAGAASEAVKDALERARRASEEGDATAAARATDEARRALEQSLEDQRLLGPVVSASQDEAARTAERLQRAVEGLPRETAGETEALDTASRELSGASEAMHNASGESRGQQAPRAARSAAEAGSALERAREALAGVREQKARAASQAAAAGARELAQRQRELAEAAREAGREASEGSMTPEAERQVEEDLREASEAMEQAASEMTAGRSASAARSQRSALEAMQRAQEEAQGGVRPTEEEDIARAQELAQEQHQIERELLDLATRNRERKGSRELPGLEGARNAAGRAGSNLESGDLDEATEDEQEVQQQLQQALNDLSEEEQQYQQLRQEELLFRISEEVSALLEGHREAIRQVREIDASREPMERPSRAQRLRLRRTAGDEALLATRAGEIADAIEAERSVVFAEILREVQQDLVRVSRDLSEVGDYQTGTRVQALQEDVEEAATWVLDALRREQQRQQSQQQQQQQGQPQEPPTPRLVPDTAELKLLQRLEVDLLDRINHMRLLYPELGDPNVEPDPYVLEDILRVAERHERTSELFEQFRRRIGIPDLGVEGEPPGEPTGEPAPEETPESEESAPR